VDALDDYRFEVAIAVRPKHHWLVQLDLALKHGTAENETNTLAEVAGVDDELGVDVIELLRLLELLFVLLVCTINHF